MCAVLRFGVLGALEVVDGEGNALELGGRQPRTIVALLIAAAGRPVPAAVVIDTLWGETPPASAAGTVQSYVSRLRRTFGEDAELRFDDRGYRLDVDPDAVDFRRFEALAVEGAELLDRDDPAGARARLVDALSLWRGPALNEFTDLDFASGPATRLDEARLAALEQRIEADLRLGRHTSVTGELHELVAEHPLRERLREQLALALYRSGRQAEALRVLADAARTLRDELGIEPSRPLRDLEAAILEHDPALDLTSAPAAAPAAAPPAAAAIAPGADPDGGGAADLDGGPGATSTPPPLERFVGRDAELAELVAAFAESRDDARFVVVEGEPGIGKTRLADELRARAARAGAVAVWGRSDEGGAAPALWPWLVPLRTLAAGLPDVAAVTELLGGEADALPGQATTMQFERFEAVAELLEQASASAPVVILLDDLQWADPTSLELLSFLSGRLARGVLVLATMRQLEVGRSDALTDALAAVARRPGSRRLALRGLTSDDTAAVLARAAGRVLDEPVTAAIHARAEGNPFYALELGRLVDEEGGLRDEVPGTVRDVIRRRLGHLPDATVELLGVAAVVGRDVELGLLARAAGRPPDETLDAIEPAISHRLLVEVPDRPGELRFSHALVREVLVEDLTSLRRARLHLKVADAIEAAGTGVDDAEILAEHLWRAAPVGVGERASVALEAAADVAVGRVSFGAAEVLLSRAARLRRATSTGADGDQAELRTLLRLLDVARALRYYQGAERELVVRAKELADRCGEHDIARNLLWFEWSALATACRIDEAAPLARAYLATTGEDPRPDVRAEGHEVYAISRWGAGGITEAAEHLDEAEALFSGVPFPEDDFRRERRLVTRSFWLWHHAAIGDVPRADVWAGFDELLALVPDRQFVVSTCGFASTLAILLGDWEAVDRYTRIASRADPGLQFSFWSAQTLMHLGILAAHRGEVAEADARFGEGRTRYTGTGGRSGLAGFEAALAIELSRHGEAAAAARATTDARAELDTYHERWNEPLVLLAEAAVAHSRGDEDEVDRLLTETTATVRAQGSLALLDRVRRLAEELGRSAPA